MENFTILLDGSLAPTARLKGQITGSRVIAADGGIRHAAALGLAPELWLGDFDSAEPALQKQFARVPKRRFPAAKDKTDGELAIDAALERGAKKLILCGAFGGARLDHGLLHINLAIALAEKGISCLLTDGGTEGYPLIKGEYCFDFPQGSLFSIIGQTDIEGLVIRGAKWNLEKRRLKFGSSLALSNETCGIISISAESGYGILLAQPKL